MDKYLNTGGLCCLPLLLNLNFLRNRIKTRTGFVWKVSWTMSWSEVPEIIPVAVVDSSSINLNEIGQEQKFI